MVLFRVCSPERRAGWRQAEQGDGRGTSIVATVFLTSTDWRDRIPDSRTIAGRLDEKIQAS